MGFKKRGYFFILDAMLGLSVLFIGIILISSSYVNVPQHSQVELLADDLLNFVSKRKIQDLNNPYAGIGGELWKQGIITNPDNSLLQQIGELYEKKEFDTVEKFIQNISKDVMPPQYRYEVWLDNAIIYPKSPTIEHFKSKENTRVLLTAKKLTFGIKNQTTSSLWGPYKAEVFVWEKQ